MNVEANDILNPPTGVGFVHAHIWAAEGTPEFEQESVAGTKDPIELDLEEQADYGAYVQYAVRLPDGRLLELRLFRKCTCGAANPHPAGDHEEGCVLNQ